MLHYYMKLQMSLKNMSPDIYQVELFGSGSLSVMAKPVSGEWIEDEFSRIKRYGTDRIVSLLIVSLLEDHEAHEIGLGEESAVAMRYKMEFVLFPIPDRGLPSSMEEYLKFTKRLYHDASEGLNTLIHCRAGIGRTGIVAAGELMHCGFKPLEAFKHISRRRGVDVSDTEEQREWVVKSYEKMLHMDPLS